MDRIPGWQWVALYVPAFLILAAVTGASLVLDVPLAAFTVDVNASGRVHPLVGMLSNVGVLMWCAAGAICVFTGVILYGRNLIPGAKFWLASGAFTLWLMFDDFFQFHERLAEMYLGLEEEAVLGFYALAALLYVKAFGGQIRNRTYEFIVLAVTFFAVSILVDKGLDSQSNWALFFEDGSKFLGIVSLFGFFVREAYIVAMTETPAAATAGKLERDWVKA